jgi:hypothetical protein
MMTIGAKIEGWLSPGWVLRLQSLSTRFRSAMEGCADSDLDAGGGS